ncbi:hypothetical protein GALL_388040 [mine drainage metagenome]|uniref:Uncharacterized protein n=1 Tax=mine drainage metagenome TaxID=410659 RepID=A0A1J5Q8F0_9ZZZZ
MHLHRRGARRRAARGRRVAAGGGHPGDAGGAARGHRRVGRAAQAQAPAHLRDHVGQEGCVLRAGLDQPAGVLEHGQRRGVVAALRGGVAGQHQRQHVVRIQRQRLPRQPLGLAQRAAVGGHCQRVGVFGQPAGVTLQLRADAAVGLRRLVELADHAVRAAEHRPAVRIVGVRGELGGQRIDHLAHFGRRRRGAGLRGDAGRRRGAAQRARRAEQHVQQRAADRHDQRQRDDGRRGAARAHLLHHRRRILEHAARQLVAGTLELGFAQRRTIALERGEFVAQQARVHRGAVDAGELAVAQQRQQQNR